MRKYFIQKKIIKNFIMSSLFNSFAHLNTLIYITLKMFQQIEILLGSPTTVFSLAGSFG